MKHCKHCTLPAIPAQVCEQCGDIVCHFCQYQHHCRDCAAPKITRLAMLPQYTLYDLRTWVAHATDLTNFVMLTHARWLKQQDRRTHVDTVAHHAAFMCTWVPTARPIEVTTYLYIRDRELYWMDQGIVITACDSATKRYAMPSALSGATSDDIVTAIQSSIDDLYTLTHDEVQRLIKPFLNPSYY